MKIIEFFMTKEELRYGLYGTAFIRVALVSFFIGWLILISFSEKVNL